MLVEGKHVCSQIIEVTLPGNVSQRIPPSSPRDPVTVARPSKRVFLALPRPPVDASAGRLGPSATVAKC